VKGRNRVVGGAGRRGGATSGGGAEARSGGAIVDPAWNTGLTRSAIGNSYFVKTVVAKNVLSLAFHYAYHIIGRVITYK
jgi:hypothetical protein